MLLNDPERAGQQVLFDGMGEETRYPTDIDGAMDFDGLIFIFFELKVKGTRMPRGQKRFFQSVIDTLNDGGGIAYAILAEHTTPVPEPIYAAKTTVKSVYYKGDWQPPHTRNITLNEAVESILRAWSSHSPEYQKRLKRFLTN